MLQRYNMHSGIHDEMSSNGPLITLPDTRGAANRVLTFAIHTIRYTGTIHLEGSIVVDPAEADWFALVDPIIMVAPNAYMMSGIGADHGTTTKPNTNAKIFVVRANIVNVRVRSDRSYLVEPVVTTTIPAIYGAIDRVTLIA